MRARLERSGEVRGCRKQFPRKQERQAGKLPLLAFRADHEEERSVLFSYSNGNVKLLIHTLPPLLSAIPADTRRLAVRGGCCRERIVKRDDVERQKGGRACWMARLRPECRECLERAGAPKPKRVYISREVWLRELRAIPRRGEGKMRAIADLASRMRCTFDHVRRMERELRGELSA